VTQPGYRHRIIIMDRSGSIKKILAGQQSGLEEFFHGERQVPGKVTVSLWDFDTEIRCVHSFATLDEVEGYQIEPRGTTALHDAAGDAVEAEGAKLAAVPEGERPEDVTVIIASDGKENSSVRRAGADVKQILAHQQDVYRWRVIYMGANQDAFAEGEKIGAHASLTVNYAGTNAGSADSWAATSALLRRAPVAAGASCGYNFTEDERDLAGSSEVRPPQTP
jgi:hypothetical protein